MKAVFLDFKSVDVDDLDLSALHRSHDDWTLHDETYHNETAARRIKVLYTLLDAPRTPIVVTTIGAFLKRVIPKSEMGAYAELLMIGEDLDRSQLVEKLIDGGYSHSQIVEEPGDFCVRGGILDIFCPLYDHPLRVEFFGDTIDSLRFFSADTQRRVGELEEAVVSPAREAILPSDRLPEIISRIRLQANDQQLPKHEARRLISGIKEDKRFPGIESLLPLISPKLDTLLAYLPSNALMVEVEPADIEKAAIEVSERAVQHYDAARACGKLPASTASSTAFSIARAAVRPRCTTSLRSKITALQSPMALCSRLIALATPKIIAPLSWNSSTWPRP